MAPLDDVPIEQPEVALLDDAAVLEELALVVDDPPLPPLLELDALDALDALDDEAELDVDPTARDPPLPAAFASVPLPLHATPRAPAPPSAMTSADLTLETTKQRTLNPKGDGSRWRGGYQVTGFYQVSL
jgi:hypothetical protein